ncbi:hypothetical protein [Amycolatopsis sp. WAC 04197]|uniref:hypothetical protein n=1 Tax=Amycolatopsis sp. WAC 04197 TaxID=2203199 RepID=UPI000F7B63CE|nr:hypothetical protein [Amycolatopsis sp. WAC 04197]
MADNENKFLVGANVEPAPDFDAGLYKSVSEMERAAEKLLKNAKNDVSGFEYLSGNSSLEHSTSAERWYRLEKDFKSAVDHLGEVNEKFAKEIKGVQDSLSGASADAFQDYASGIHKQSDELFSTLTEKQYGTTIGNVGHSIQSFAAKWWEIKSNSKKNHKSSQDDLKKDASVRIDNAQDLAEVSQINTQLKTDLEALKTRTEGDLVRELQELFNSLARQYETRVHDLAPLHIVDGHANRPEPTPPAADNSPAADTTTPTPDTTPAPDTTTPTDTTPTPDTAPAPDTTATTPASPSTGGATSGGAAPPSSTGSSTPASTAPAAGALPTNSAPGTPANSPAMPSTGVPASSTAPAADTTPAADTKPSAASTPTTPAIPTTSPASPSTGGATSGGAAPPSSTGSSTPASTAPAADALPATSSAPAMPAASPATPSTGASSGAPAGSAAPAAAPPADTQPGSGEAPAVTDRDERQEALEEAKAAVDRVLDRAIDQQDPDKPEPAAQGGGASSGSAGPDSWRAQLDQAHQAVDQAIEALGSDSDSPARQQALEEAEAAVDKAFESVEEQDSMASFLDGSEHGDRHEHHHHEDHRRGHHDDAGREPSHERGRHGERPEHAHAGPWQQGNRRGHEDGHRPPWTVREP